MGFDCIRSRFVSIVCLRNWGVFVCKGTRDFGPEEFRLRQWLFGEFEAVSRLFGFEQFETPVLESEELFVRKAGEEITHQLYNFEVRPELPP